LDEYPEAYPSQWPWDVRLVSLHGAIVADVRPGLLLRFGAVGLFGVIDYAVGRRIHEVGIRMASGAQGAHVLLMILGRGLWLIPLGLTIGLGGALALNRAVSSVLFGVSTTDVATLLSASLIWLTVSALACYIPRRGEP
jgi:putative ABC transport system permease protein